MQLENFFQRLPVTNQLFEITKQSDIYFIVIRCKTSYKYKFIYVGTIAIIKNILFKLNGDIKTIYGKAINKKYI